MSTTKGFPNTQNDQVEDNYITNSKSNILQTQDKMSSYVFIHFPASLNEIPVSGFNVLM